MTAVAALRTLDDDVANDQEGSQVAVGRHGWISSPKRRETATSGPSPTPGERLLNTESGHLKVIAGRRQFG